MRRHLTIAGLLLIAGAFSVSLLGAAELIVMGAVIAWAVICAAVAATHNVTTAEEQEHHE